LCTSWGAALDYLTPIRLQDALTALETGAPSIIAGGTDSYPVQGEKPIRCDMLDVTRIEGLRGISRDAKGWRIGAASTWTDIINTDLPHAFDGLKAAAREVGSVQIQNAGTIAGNLCNASPAADGVPPLLTLNAQVELGSLNGTRVLPLSDFITGVRQIALEADELVTAVFIPDLSKTRKSSFVKLGARKYLVISIAMVAVTCEVTEGVLSDVHVAVGSCSPVAQRLVELEAALEGVRVNDVETVIANADLSRLSPIDDVRGSGGYRLDVVAPLIKRALKEAAHG
jgi:CO/xanthine dehydrogenase FAD-binding subunit